MSFGTFEGLSNSFYKSSSVISSLLIRSTVPAEKFSVCRDWILEENATSLVASNVHLSCLENFISICVDHGTIAEKNDLFLKEDWFESFFNFFGILVEKLQGNESGLYQQFNSVVLKYMELNFIRAVVDRSVYALLSHVGKITNFNTVPSAVLFPYRRILDLLFMKFEKAATSENIINSTISGNIHIKFNSYFSVFTPFIRSCIAVLIPSVLPHLVFSFLSNCSRPTQTIGAINYSDIFLLEFGTTLTSGEKHVWPTCVIPYIKQALLFSLYSNLVSVRMQILKPECLDFVADLDSILLWCGEEIGFLFTENCFLSSSFCNFIQKSVDFSHEIRLSVEFVGSIIDCINRTNISSSFDAMFCDIEILYNSFLNEYTHTYVIVSSGKLIENENRCSQVLLLHKGYVVDIKKSSCVLKFFWLLLHSSPKLLSWIIFGALFLQNSQINLVCSEILCIYYDPNEFEEILSQRCITTNKVQPFLCMLSNIRNQLYLLQNSGEIPSFSWVQSLENFIYFTRVHLKLRISLTPWYAHYISFYLYRQFNTCCEINHICDRHYELINLCISVFYSAIKLSTERNVNVSLLFNFGFVENICDVCLELSNSLSEFVGNNGRRVRYQCASVFIKYLELMKQNLNLVSKVRQDRVNNVWKKCISILTNLDKDD